MNSIADIAGTPPSRVPNLSHVGDLKELREKVGEFVGLTFFAPVLKQASDWVLKGKYGHGGRGEEVFRGQLNELLALRMGKSGRLGLTDELVKRLSTPRAAMVKAEAQRQA